MPKIPHTVEEVTWMKSIIKQYPKLTPKIIRKEKLHEKFSKKFNRHIGVDGMYTWKNVLSNPSVYSYKARRQRLLERKNNPNYVAPRQSKKNPVSVFLKSNYIVIVAGQVMGFETTEEVTNFIASSQILGGVKLFKHQSIKINYDVQIGD